MASSTKTFTIKINGVDTAIKSVNELEDSVKQLENELNTAEFGSENFDQLRSDLVAASSHLETFKQSVEPITNSQIADGFLKMGEAAAGAVGLIGTGLIAFGASSEDVEKVQAKLQGVTAALQSVQMITEGLNAENVRSISLALQSAEAWVQTGTAAKAATTAGATGIKGLGQSFVGFGKALLSNPIFLIAAVITGILAATGNLEKTLKVIGGTLAKVFEPFGDILKRVSKDFKPLIDAAIEFLPPLIQISTLSSRILLPVFKALLPVIDALSGAIEFFANGLSNMANVVSTSVTSLTDFIGITNSSKDAQEDFDATIEASIKYQTEYEEAIGRTNRAKERELEVLKASGASAKEVNKAELELLKTKSDQIKAELDYAVALYKRIEAAGQLKAVSEDQLKSLVELNQKYLDAANAVVVKEKEIDTERKQSAADRAKENKDALDSLKAQIAERLKLSEIGLGLENLDKDLQDLEDKLKKVDQTNIEGILEAQVIEEKIVESRKSILQKNADNAAAKEEEISINLKKELDKRTFIGEAGEKEKARLIKEIDDSLKNNLEVNQSNLNQAKKKLDDDYKKSVEENSKEITKKLEDEAKKSLDIKNAELEGRKKANDKIANNEEISSDERIVATRKSAEIQKEIILNRAEEALIGLKEDSLEYKEVIRKRDEAIVDLAETTQDKIDKIDEDARAKRKAKIMSIASDSVEALSELVNIANQIISSMTAEVDARIEETETRIDALQTFQSDLLTQQETLEQELQSARGQRAEDLLLQINNLSAARSAAAKQEQAQNKILAEQEKKKAELARASAIASAIQTTVQAGLAVATAFTANAAYPIVGVIAALAFVSSLIGSIAAIKNAAKFEKGGEVGGKLHKDGGTMIEAEKGEFVINRKATQNNIGLLKQINSEGSSKTLARKYENGGVVGINSSTFNALNSNSNANVSDNIKQLQSQIDAMANRPVYVSVQDINDGQKGYAKIKNSVSF